jgi:hypothetical protein
MKNFSELLATDLQLEFELKLEPHHSPLSVRVWLNNNLIYNSLLEKSFTYAARLNLLDPIDLKISVLGKDYNLDNQSAVLIKTFKIDDFEILLNWTQLAVYDNDHNYTDPTTHLGFNGSWQYLIPEPFYQWKHKITGQGWLLTPA